MYSARHPKRKLKCKYAEMVEMGKLYLGFSLPIMDERFIMVDFKSISLLKKIFQNII